MTTLSKAIYRFNTLPIKLPMALSTKLEQNFFHLYGNTRPEKAKIILKKDRTVSINFPDLKLYYKATV